MSLFIPGAYERAAATPVNTRARQVRKVNLPTIMDGPEEPAENRHVSGMEEKFLDITGGNIAVFSLSG